VNRRKFLQAAGIGAGMGLSGAAWPFHRDGSPLIQPSYGEIGGLEILGYNDMRLPGQPRAPGWDQSYEFRVIDTRKGRFAYVGNGSMGWSIVNVSDPRRMHVVWRQPHLATSHSGTTDNTQYIDIKGDDILVVKRNKALETWDVRDPARPRFLASYQPSDIHLTARAPIHGLWVHEDGRGGRYAFAAFRPADYSAEILDICDITNPRHPIGIARWWYPGMRRGEESIRTWWSPDSPNNGPEPAPQLALPAPTVMCHDMTSFGDRCYAAWRDKGLVILDISDIRNPRRVGEVNWADQQKRGDVMMPPLPGHTHSWGIVVPKEGDKVEYVVGGDETLDRTCPWGYMHFIDVRDETKPREISGYRSPLNMHANCPADRPGVRFGLHDVERMIKGNIVWSAWEEACFWGIDYSDIHHPKAVAWFVPPVRSDSPTQSAHADDVFVMDDGTIFGSSSDTGAGGLWAMRYRPGFTGTVRWNADQSNVIVTAS
jgi:hypothetical protein